MLDTNPLYQLRLHKEGMCKSVNTTTTTKITQNAFEESEFSKLLKNYQSERKPFLSAHATVFSCSQHWECMKILGTGWKATILLSIPMFQWRGWQRVEISVGTMDQSPFLTLFS